MTQPIQKRPEPTSKLVFPIQRRAIGKLPDELQRSLTWDQGKEMHAQKRFTVATNVQVYFCDPRSRWQRGSNENTNGLLVSTSREEPTSRASLRVI